ncbi:hypothetical protein NXW39_04410 [Bacteroides fragilis]|uniref:Uncharacterized protein n=1 Tax=Bacteroides fragilis TaxID=817 RepID=A0A9X9NGL4_BACFG|nr:hypothetical protein NXW39_04410 [Bacteroides fragilis]
MEVNENRGRLGRKNFRRKSVKRGNRLKEKKLHRKREKGKPPTKEVCLFPIRRNLFSRVATSILPGLSGCVRPTVSFMGQADALCIHFPLPAKGTTKKKNHLKPRKSTSWHRRKKKEAQHHQSKHRLGVRLCLFLRLCGSRHTFAQTRFGQWCSDGQNRFYGKIL